MIRSLDARTRMSRNGKGPLPARASFQPIQTEHVFAGVPQPGRNFSRLKRPISGTEVAIEQLCDFFSRARLLDLVQGSPYVFVEAAVRVWNLTLLRFAGLKLDLLRGAHFGFGLAANKNSRSRRAGWYQLENQSANGLRLVLSGSTRQSIRPFKAVWSLNSHLPILAGSRSGDGHPPLSAFVTECVLDTHNNFPAHLSIAEILQVDHHAHRIAILPRAGRTFCQCKPKHLLVNMSTEVFRAFRPSCVLGFGVLDLSIAVDHVEHHFQNESLLG